MNTTDVNGLPDYHQNQWEPMEPMRRALLKLLWGLVFFYRPAV